MSNAKRANGKLIRKVAKLDRRWRLEGKREGRVENDLAMYLGRAASRSRAMGRRSRQVQNRNALRLGEPMPWPSYGI